MSAQYKKPDPYCYFCNGTGEYYNTDRICHCTIDNYVYKETPKQAIDKVWSNCLKNNKENPIYELIYSLAYYDWYFENSEKYIKEIITIATDKIKEHFKNNPVK